jgi:hypothetical protein
MRSQIIIGLLLTHPTIGTRMDDPTIRGNEDWRAPAAPEQEARGPIVPWSIPRISAVSPIGRRITDPQTALSPWGANQPIKRA